ncbi:MAG TPA: methyltransferase domain-containing protein [Vulgatibacter sp.]|nr:methyltransferase domain-containing protein [Vulgatibacter sp.]
MDESSQAESGAPVAEHEGPVTPGVVDAVAANRALSGPLPNQAIHWHDLGFSVLPEEGGEASSRSRLERAVRRLARSFVDANRMASHRLNLACEARFGRVDGSTHFGAHLDRALRPGLRVVDLGGGKHPAISVETKARLGLHVVGVDVSSEELRLAPEGAYDRAVVADATRFCEPGTADLVIAQALAEHVRDTGELWHRIHECLVPGGRALVFIPNGRAIFARLNRVLPEDTKRWLLYRLYPGAAHYQGFPAYYDRCSPTETLRLLAAVGFRDVTMQPYYSSNYFSFFYPAHLLEVALQLAAKALDRDDACESFVVEAVK